MCQAALSSAGKNNEISRPKTQNTHSPVSVRSMSIVRFNVGYYYTRFTEFVDLKGNSGRDDVVLADA